jgi:hypothetical protein
MSTCALGRAKAVFDNPISKPAAAINMYLDVFIFVLPFFTFQPFCSPIQTLSTGLLLQIMPKKLYHKNGEVNCAKKSWVIWGSTKRASAIAKGLWRTRVRV